MDRARLARCGDEPNFLRAGVSRQALRKLRSGAW